MLKSRWLCTDCDKKAKTKLDLSFCDSRDRQGNAVDCNKSHVVPLCLRTEWLLKKKGGVRLKRAFE